VTTGRNSLKHGELAMLGGAFLFLDIYLKIKK
jgi:hypothetical protein